MLFLELSGALLSGRQNQRYVLETILLAGHFARRHGVSGLREVCRLELVRWKHGYIFLEVGGLV